MLNDPAHPGIFKTNIPARLFLFKPLVFEDLLAFRQELTIERGLFKQTIRHSSVGYFFEGFHPANTQG